MAINTAHQQHGFHQSPEGYDHVTFLEVDPKVQDLTRLPNTFSISEQAERYYPVFLSLNAPTNLPLSLCLTPCCSNKGPFYNCNDCFHSNAYCQDCIKSQHEKLPFHRICVWDGEIGCYNPVRWTDLGMVWKLVHDDGTPCSSCSTTRQLQVLHVNGIHDFTYYQCTCHFDQRKTSTVQPTQLLANKLFPATSNAPTSAFSFELLSLFDMLNIFAFANIKQFCDGIISLTPRVLRFHGEV
jgi:hypothetical protein